jgi:hypothetical protein
MRAPYRGGAGGGRYHQTVSALEVFYTSLLAVSALAVGWFACFVVYRLYRGQS